MSQPPHGAPKAFSTILFDYYLCHFNILHQKFKIGEGSGDAPRTSAITAQTFHSQKSRTVKQHIFQLNRMIEILLAIFKLFLFFFYILFRD